MIRFYAESFAPWCEKARWALDHHQVVYRFVEHVPMLGEPALRLAARRPFGYVTVPLLVDGANVVMGSFDIARHAEHAGVQAPLFPPGREDHVVAWNERSDAVMTSGRAMLLSRMLRSPQALAEQLPPFVPAGLRPALRGLASMGVKFLQRKHGIRPEEDARHEAVSRTALDALRAALASGRRYLLGDALSYADIAMATSLQFVLPVDQRHIALGPATREAWTNATLASEYADLLTWRDTLYRTSR
jgi:glutathione S-transferase